MVSKMDFTEQEWKQILFAPQMASLVVMLASPSGPLGAVKEMFASSKQLGEAVKASTGNALIDAVVADLKEKVEAREKVEAPVMGKKPDEIKGQCLQACRDLAVLLSQKAPTEADEYKQWVYQAAQASAEATQEGGFLGIGGKRVSEAEVAALGEIAAALGVSA
ncbi:MAG: hypothetical protein JXM73_07655 [Anaerolineae bacterium]|nr:hypothetical protein [Anaerolineae bacterium]